MLTINNLELIFQDFPAPALILAATESLEIVKANTAYLHLLNKPQDYLCGQPLFKLFPDQEEGNPESVVKVTHRTIRQVISSKQPQTCGAIAYYLPNDRSPEKSLRFFMPDYVPVIDETGAVAYIFHFTREVKGELAAKAADSTIQTFPYEKFIETSQNPYFLSKPDGTSIGVNQAACDLFGYTRNEFKTVLRSDVLDCNDARFQALLIQRERTGKGRGEVIGIKKNGERFPCEYSSVTFDDHTGEKQYCTEIIDLTKWKQAETKAHQSEENLHAILNSTVDGFVLVNTELQVVAYNDKAKNFIFLNSDLHTVPIGSSIFEYVDDSRRGFFSEVTKRVLAGETIEYEHSYQHRTDEKHWFIFSLNPVKESGRITGICISARDITFQKRAEEERINSEKRFRGLVEHNIDAIAILSEEGQVLYVSPAAERINGYSEEEARQMDVFQIIHKADRPKAVQVMQQVMEQPGIPVKAAPIRMRHKNGSWRWVEATITNMLHDPAIGGIIDNFRDVTQRIESEQKLLQATRQAELSKEKYRKIFNLSPLPKWIYDLDTLRILEVNEQAVKHYGYSRAEFLKMTILNVRPLQDIDLVKEVLKDLKDSSVSKLGYWRHLKKNGEIIMVDITGHPIEFNGRNARMVICKDVTVMLKAQTELIHSIERFRQAARATSDAIWDWDMATETVFLGEGYATLFGYSDGVNNVHRSWIQEKIHPDDRAHVRQKLMR